MQPYQNTNGIFHRTRKYSKICMETQKNSNSQNNLKKTEAEVSVFLISNYTTKMQ